MSSAPTVPAPAARAGAHSVRAHNLSVALHQVVTASEPVSRAGIAAATGLSRSTASRLVDALVSARLVAELPPRTPVGAGRPAAGLVVSPSGPAGLGLEINVDYVAVCVVDLLGVSRYPRGRRRRPARSLAGAGGRQRSPASRPPPSARPTAEGLRVVAATVALPGLVDVDEGRLRLAPNLGWRNVDVVASAAPPRGPRRPADRHRQRGEPCGDWPSWRPAQHGRHVPAHLG